MTIPTRPAPPPPSNSQVIVTGQSVNNNSNRQQFHLLERQHQKEQLCFDQQLPKLMIKLPPPPKGSIASSITIVTNNSKYSNGNSSITRKFPQARYTPTTDWADSPFDLLNNSKTDSVSSNIYSHKKIPPPRPPPPKIQAQKIVPPKSSIAQQFPNHILHNLFHRKKSLRILSAKMPAVTNTINCNSFSNNLSSSNGSNWYNLLNEQQNNNVDNSTNSTRNNIQQQETQLISFDSPPSSPTFTQKSNSDCLSVDSFSSDSNFGSPNNGNASQPESGFEDEFNMTIRHSRPTTSPLDPWDTLDKGFIGSSDLSNNIMSSHYTSIGTVPVRNLNAVLRSHKTNTDNPLCNGKNLIPTQPVLQMPTIIKPKISQKPKAPKPPVILTNSISNFTSLKSSIPSPPMPQCAPPPPPAILSGIVDNTESLSELDIEWNKDNILAAGDHQYETTNNTNTDLITKMQPPYGIALYDFHSNENGDLNFRENEKIYLLEMVNSDWYKGRTRAGCEGIFPANYIKIEVPLMVNNTDTMKQLQAKVLYNFSAEVEGDLALNENDLVTILYRINDDWLFGEAHGKRGQFPANFLEHVPQHIPTCK